MSATTAPIIKPPKPKKVVQASGRGGSGNYRKVKEKSSTTEVTRSNPTTARKLIEVDIPRYKAAYTGRGGRGNAMDHVLEDGVFQRVIGYELSKVQVYREERDAARRQSQSARTRRMSNATKPSKSSIFGSDELSSSGGSSIQRQSWASKSAADISSTAFSMATTTTHTRAENSNHHNPSRKSLRETLLAPLRTTFIRSPASTKRHSRDSHHPTSPGSLRDDTSSFWAGSSTDLGHDTGANPPHSPRLEFHPEVEEREHEYGHGHGHGGEHEGEHGGEGEEEDVPPISPASDETYSAAPTLLTPSTGGTAEMFGRLAGKPVPRRRSTGTQHHPHQHPHHPHRQQQQGGNGHYHPHAMNRLSGPLIIKLSPLPSPTIPLPPLPSIQVEDEGDDAGEGATQQTIYASPSPSPCSYSPPRPSLIRASMAHHHHHYQQQQQQQQQPSPSPSPFPSPKSSLQARISMKSMRATPAPVIVVAPSSSSSSSSLLQLSSIATTATTANANSNGRGGVVASSSSSSFGSEDNKEDVEPRSTSSDRGPNANASLGAELGASGSGSDGSSGSRPRLLAPEGRAPNRRFYNASIAAGAAAASAAGAAAAAAASMSKGHLPVSFDTREASVYEDTDVDRVDPFLTEVTHAHAHIAHPRYASSQNLDEDGYSHHSKSLTGSLLDLDVALEEMPWLNVNVDVDASRRGAIISSSASSISIPSFNESRPELVPA